MSRRANIGLRLARIIIAAAAFTAVTALFVVPASWASAYLWRVGALQWLPSAMGFSLGVAVGWLAATLLLGRVYCSTLCPLGTAMDLAARLRRSLGKGTPYRHRPARPMLRNAVVALTIVTLMLGLTLPAALLDPFSAWGRVCHAIINPLVRLQWPLTLGASLFGVAVAWLTVVLVSTIAWKRGRLWCSTVCPVGTAMGYISRNSVMKIDIDTDRCTRCRRCEWVCKAECINVTEGTVDASRCVVCFDCLTACNDDAISYTFTRKQLSLPMLQSVERPAEAATCGKNSASAMSRRRFIATGIAALSLPAIARVTDSSPAAHMPPVPPPGIPSPELFANRCTACGLCVARCKGKVLRASVHEYGWLRTMQPLMDYERGWCITSCNECTQVCPTDAIGRLTLDEKNRFIIGTAEVAASICTGCGDCVRACPREAVTLEGGVAVVDPGLCVGCGACQHICPVRPARAIRVRALL